MKYLYVHALIKRHSLLELICISLLLCFRSYDSSPFQYGLIILLFLDFIIVIDISENVFQFTLHIDKDLLRVYE